MSEALLLGVLLAVLVGSRAAAAGGVSREGGGQMASSIVGVLPCHRAAAAGSSPAPLSEWLLTAGGITTKAEAVEQARQLQAAMGAVRGRKAGRRPGRPKAGTAEDSRKERAGGSVLRLRWCQGCGWAGVRACSSVLKWMRRLFLCVEG